MNLERIDRQVLEEETRRALDRGVDRDPREILRWAHELLGERLMMTTAFGKSGMVILDLVRQVCPDLHVHFIDTRFHFRQTLDYIGRVEEKFGIEIRRQRPVVSLESFIAEHGPGLYETNPDLCCHINKVEPMDRLLRGYQGWISGLRRDQSKSRASTEPLEILEPDLLKVHPLVHWTRDDVEKYLEEHRIPLHPLFSQGYLSIGCEPCTRPATNPGDERSGRWAGKDKTECGLHLFRQKARPTPPEEEPPVADDDSPAGDEPPDGEETPPPDSKS